MSATQDQTVWVRESLLATELLIPATPLIFNPLSLSDPDTKYTDLTAGKLGFRIPPGLSAHF